MLWSDGQAYDLNSLVVGGFDGLGTLSQARGINDAGQIVGIATLADGSGQHAFLLTPVPEPQHWAMLLGGLCVLAWSARRKA